MKKALFAASVALLFSVSAHAECTMSYHADQAILAAIKKSGGLELKNFDSLCQKLRRANARIHISAQAEVLNNNSIGWAEVSVLDAKTSIASTDFASTSTFVNAFASSDKAEQLMVQAAQDAIDNWRSLDDALTTLDRERRQVRIALK